MEDIHNLDAAKLRDEAKSLLDTAIRSAIGVFAMKTLGQDGAQHKEAIESFFAELNKNPTGTIKKEFGLDIDKFKEQGIAVDESYIKQVLDDEQANYWAASSRGPEAVRQFYGGAEEKLKKIQGVRQESEGLSTQAMDDAKQILDKADQAKKDVAADAKDNTHAVTTKAVVSAAQSGNELMAMAEGRVGPMLSKIFSIVSSIHTAKLQAARQVLRASKKIDESAAVGIGKTLAGAATGHGDGGDHDTSVAPDFMTPKPGM